MTQPEQSNSAMAGPARPRDEAKIKARIYYACTRADDILRDMISGRPVKVAEMHEVRGLLAEWRLESD